MASTPGRRKKDLVLVHSRTDDGAGVRILRTRQEQLEVGELRPLEEGRPIQGEVVKLSPRPELPALFDAETLLEAPAPAASPTEARGAAGPPQVASAAYRKNWDAIWNRPRRQTLN
jgi:hypothetical protein